MKRDNLSTYTIRFTISCYMHTAQSIVQYAKISSTTDKRVLHLLCIVKFAVQYTIKYYRLGVQPVLCTVRFQVQQNMQYYRSRSLTSSLYSQVCSTVQYPVLQIEEFNQFFVQSGLQYSTISSTLQIEEFYEQSS